MTIAAGIATFFEPRSVAVIGASRMPGKAGYQQLVNLQRGFAGPIYPVNPQAKEILGLPCFANLRDIPGPVDLAVVLLPARQVPEAVRECAASGVPAVLIASGGFAEIGREGRELQEACLAAIRGTATRLWGPNCNGLVNTANSLLASFVDLPNIRSGPIAIVAQSGIFAAAFLNQLVEREGFGISKVATLGNACDVDPTEVLAYLIDDPATKVVALHLESIRDGAKLVETCRKLTARKPVVALVAGQTPAGAQASMSHTANLAADGRIIRDALRQAGVAEAQEYLELADIAEGLALRGRVSRARRVAVLTTTGGAGVVLADLLAQARLGLATLAPDTRRALAKYEPSVDSGSNPLDIWPAMQRQGTNIAVPGMTELVLGDPGVDAAIFVMGAFSGGGTEFEPERLRAILAKHQKPVVAWLYGPTVYLDAWHRALNGIGIPAFRDMRTAVSFLRASDRLAESGSEAEWTAPPAVLPREALSARISEFRRQGVTSLSEPESYELIRACGISSAAYCIAHSEAEAVEAALKLGGAIILKVVSRDIAHKAELGGVAVSLSGEAEVRAAYKQILRDVGRSLPSATIDGVLVQEYLHGGREVIVGIIRKGQFGRVVMVGLGGGSVELMGRVAFGVPPLRSADIDRMIEDSGIDAFLRGNSSRDKLREALVSLSRLIEAGLEIDQLEINPLLILEGGRNAVAVDAVIRLSPSEAGHLQQQ